MVDCRLCCVLPYRWRVDRLPLVCVHGGNVVGILDHFLGWFDGCTSFDRERGAVVQYWAIWQGIGCGVGNMAGWSVLGQGKGSIVGSRCFGLSGLRLTGCSGRAGSRFGAAHPCYLPLIRDYDRLYFVATFIW